MRWLLIDEFVAIDRGLRAMARSHVPDEEFSAEPLMIEMMAQTGAVLLGAESNFQNDVIFAKIEDASFQGNCRPGELLEIEASSERLGSEGAWFDGKIRGEAGREVGTARFLLMSVGRFLPGKNEPITFHQAFMNHFQIREKVKA